MKKNNHDKGFGFGSRMSSDDPKNGTDTPATPSGTPTPANTGDGSAANHPANKPADKVSAAALMVYISRTNPDTHESQFNSDVVDVICESADNAQRDRIGTLIAFLYHGNSEIKTACDAITAATQEEQFDAATYASADSKKLRKHFQDALRGTLPANDSEKASLLNLCAVVTAIDDDLRDKVRVAPAFSQKSHLMMGLLAKDGKVYEDAEAIRVANTELDKGPSVFWVAADGITYAGSPNTKEARDYLKKVAKFRARIRLLEDTLATNGIPVPPKD